MEIIIFPPAAMKILSNKMCLPGHGLQLIWLNFPQALNSFSLTAKTRCRSNTWRS